MCNLVPLLMAEAGTLMCAGTVENKLVLVKPPDDVDYDLKTYTSYYGFCSRHTHSKMEGSGRVLYQKYFL